MKAATEMKAETEIETETETETETEAMTQSMSTLDVITMMKILVPHAANAEDDVKAKVLHSQVAIEEEDVVATAAVVLALVALVAFADKIEPISV